MTSTSETERPRRADAERNHVRLIEAAAAAFRESGFDVGVAEIARRAGVGSATLFRNFPTKDDLILAVIETRLTESLAICRRAWDVEDPATAFEQMMYEIAALQARDVGFFEAMHSRVIDEPKLDEPMQRLVEIAGRVLNRAQRAGVVRDDVIAEDLRYLLISAVAQNRTDEASPDLYRRYLRIMLDGLRPNGSSPLPAAPQQPDATRLR